MANQNSSSAWQGMSALLKLFQVVTAGAVIFGLAYLLGYTTLIGPLKGNDSALHIAYATWLDQYFPQIPHWYPLQGGGESILHGYPVLAHLLVVALHRLSGLSILQAYRLLSFLTFPVTALGIYFLGWLYFRKQTLGLIAAMFFLLAPITWTWMYDWGFFAQSVAMVFLPYSLICFDRYLSQVIEGSKSVWRGFWFLALVLSLALASLTHLIVGIAAVTGMALFTVISSLTAEPGSRGRILIKGLLASLASGALVALILAFYLVPFYLYSQVANREGLNNPAPHQLPRLPVAEFLGISPMDPTQILTRMQFPLVVTIFFVIGLVLALRSSRKALTICLVTILGMLYVLMPELPAIVLGISPTVFMLFNFRTLLMVV
ncbi:MAG: hypothetical protein HYX86_06600, partial [Chloroflexi bacterium]|nr:hypothetical protein [Chloroflexota bacterium]